ncbi:MAG TPA: hypothetical protein VKU00_05885 [Chthonomonadaceae bacterium]|nr:hypothetical protein [Chthonomonadaceae bacterium]
MSYLSLKRLWSMTIACLCLLLGAPALQANTVTGNQNPDLQVAVTLESSGSNPEIASAGDVLTGSWTVVNTTGRELTVKVKYVWEPPAQAVHVVHKVYTLKAHGVLHYSGTFRITKQISTGQFNLSMEATDDIGTGFKSYSAATANVTIVASG